MLSSVLISGNDAKDFNANVADVLRWISENKAQLINVKFCTSPLVMGQPIDPKPSSIAGITKYSALIIMDKPV